MRNFGAHPTTRAPLAEQVAAQYGAQHQTIWATKRDFQDNFSRVMRAMDQPTCDGINSFFVSLAAARAGLKVALSGLGGDEMFGGYPSFREIPRIVRLLRPFSLSAFQPFNRGFRILSAPLLRRMTSPKYAGLLEYGGTYGGAYLLRRGMFMPWELPSLLDRTSSARAGTAFRPSHGCKKHPKASNPPVLGSPRWNPAGTCATNSSATPTGPAWTTPSKSGHHLLMPPSFAS